MKRILGAALVAMATVVSACSVGDGTGAVTGSMRVPACLTDLSAYDMQPDFFGAVAYHQQLIIRIQHGGDLSEFTDSLIIQIDNVDTIQAAITAANVAHAADPSQPTGADYTLTQYERPPGSAPDVAAPLVRLVISLRHSCGRPKLLPGTIADSDPTNVAMEAVAGTVHFDSIFHSDVTSRDVDSKRIQGNFSVILADPRQNASTPVSSRLSGTLSGNFKFIYERGGPAQPFP